VVPSNQRKIGGGRDQREKPRNCDFDVGSAGKGAVTETERRQRRRIANSRAAWKATAHNSHGAAACDNDVPSWENGCACTAEIPANKHTSTRQRSATAKRPLRHRQKSYFVAGARWCMGYSIKHETKVPRPGSRASSRILNSYGKSQLFFRQPAERAAGDEFQSLRTGNSPVRPQRLRWGQILRTEWPRNDRRGRAPLYGKPHIQE
jgi:hypothetical protein